MKNIWTKYIYIICLLCALNITVYANESNINEIFSNFHDSGNIAANEPFGDIAEVGWAVESINTLADWGIVSGKKAGHFSPFDDVTRAEFAKLLVGAFGLLDLNAESDFVDSTPEDWHYRYIATASKLGIAQGFSDEYFGANEPIRRQDMAIMVQKAIKLSGLSFDSIEKDPFVDQNDTSEYAADSVVYLQNIGIINGNKGMFNPKQSLNRAEAAHIIYVALSRGKIQ